MPLKILSLTCDFILVVIHSISSEFSNDFDHMMNANWATIFVSFSLHMHGAQFPVFDISTLYFLLCCTAILSVLYFFLQQFTFLSRVFLRYEMHSSNSTILHHHLRSTKLLLFFKKNVGRIACNNLFYVWSYDICLLFITEFTVESLRYWNSPPGASNRCHCTLVDIVSFPICPTNWHAYSKWW